VTVTVNQPVTSFQHLMVNTQLTADGPANSGWYVVNLKFNNDPILSAGPSDSKYPSDYARRDLMDQKISSN